MTDIEKRPHDVDFDSPDHQEKLAALYRDFALEHEAERRLSMGARHRFPTFPRRRLGVGGHHPR